MYVFRIVLLGVHVFVLSLSVALMFLFNFVVNDLVRYLLWVAVFLAEYFP